jgi:hypothetical protein
MSLNLSHQALHNQVKDNGIRRSGNDGWCGIVHSLRNIEEQKKTVKTPSFFGV